MLLLNPALASEEGTRLERTHEACEAGDLVAERARLSRLLEEGPQDDRIQAALYAIDTGIEAQYEAASTRALADAREGHFGKARQALQNLRERYAGLPWGPAAETRLREVDELEAAARKPLDPPEAPAETREEDAGREPWRRQQAAFSKLLDKSDLKARTEREALFARILAFDPALEDSTLQKLAETHQRQLKQLKSHLKQKCFRKLRENLRGDLSARRKAALDLIYDEKRYPYFGKSGGGAGEDPPDGKYGPDGKAIQAEVDRLVEAVGNPYGGWDRVSRALSQYKGLSRIRSTLEELEGYLTRAGRPPEGPSSSAGVLQEAFDGLDLAAEDRMTAAGAGILKDNEAEAKRLQGRKTLDEEEAACILATNRYRMQMGLKPLAIDERLVQAARAHSRDMASRNYFDHVAPDGKGPGDRARDAGFPGGVGENIFMGAGHGQDAFLGWRSSSGHHRNMLRPRWGRIGVARAGTHWTMVLGD